MHSRIHTSDSHPDLGRHLSGVAYLADPSAVNGAATLFGQKRAIDLYAIKQKIPIKQYVVDSGTRLAAIGLPYGLYTLLCAVRRRGAGIVFVEHISCFSRDYVVALRIAATLSSWGADLHEVRGGGPFVEPDLAGRFVVDRSGGNRSVGGREFEATERSRSNVVIFRRKSAERIS